MKNLLFEILHAKFMRNCFQVRGFVSNQSQVSIFVNTTSNHKSSILLNRFHISDAVIRVARSLKQNHLNCYPKIV